MTYGTTTRRRVSAWLLPILVGWAALTLSAADWPQYQRDASRGGYTPEELSTELSLLWSRQARHQPQPAWVGREFARSRMQFDWAYSVVGADGLVYFGSSADHKVYALDAATGAERWSAFTEGPVRLAPAIWQDRLFCISDDGYLHCFDRQTGERKWRLRAGPSGEQLIGNGRMISRWAARGGVAIEDGIVYFGAGNWPEEDVYIHAVDAATGKVLWRNDNTGALEIDQPHMVCFSRGGVIAQGYLAVAGQ
ncbi:MAG: PQQ-like beta-propeller repeat protein, partial [Victivallales bacterium]|nr:PQQ-like beta-propeller repeat protein [Victivallales bacterium]